MRKVKKQRSRLGWPFFYFFNKKRTVIDADTSWSEVLSQVGINFLWGFLGHLPAPFFAAKYDNGVYVSVFCYYYTMTFIFNRPGYTSRFGKYFVFPVPPAVGAICAYHLGYWIVALIK